jgi:hypothetical protein
MVLTRAGRMTSGNVGDTKKQQKKRPRSSSQVGVPLPSLILYHIISCHVHIQIICPVAPLHLICYCCAQKKNATKPIDTAAAPTKDDDEVATKKARPIRKEKDITTETDINSDNKHASVIQLDQNDDDESKTSTKQNDSIKENDHSNHSEEKNDNDEDVDEEKKKSKVVKSTKMKLKKEMVEPQWDGLLSIICQVLAAAAGHSTSSITTKSTKSEPSPPSSPVSDQHDNTLKSSPSPTAATSSSTKKKKKGKTKSKAKSKSSKGKSGTSKKVRRTRVGAGGNISLPMTMLVPAVLRSINSGTSTPTPTLSHDTSSSSSTNSNGTQAVVDAASVRAAVDHGIACGVLTSRSSSGSRRILMTTVGRNAYFARLTYGQSIKPIHCMQRMS